MNARRSFATFLAASATLTLVAGCSAPGGDEASSSSDAVVIGASVVGGFTSGFYDAEGAALGVVPIPSIDLQQAFSWRRELANGDNSSCAGRIDAFRGEGTVGDMPQNRVREDCNATFKEERDGSITRTGGGPTTTYRRLDPKRLAGTYVPTVDGKPFDGIGPLVLGEAQGDLADLPYALTPKASYVHKGVAKLGYGAYDAGPGWSIESLSCTNIELHPVRRGDRYEIHVSTILGEQCEFAFPRIHDVVFVKR